MVFKGRGRTKVAAPIVEAVAVGVIDKWPTGKEFVNGLHWTTISSPGQPTRRIYRVAVGPRMPPELAHKRSIIVVNDRNEAFGEGNLNHIKNLPLPV